MLKKVLNLDGIQKLDHSAQKSIKGGILLPFGDCCVCVFTPAGQQFPVLITQFCSTPCPVDGDFESGGGPGFGC